MSDQPNLLSDEDSAPLFLIAVNSVTKDNDGLTPIDQTRLLGTKLVEFAENALRGYALLELIEEGKVEPFLDEGAMAFRVTGEEK